MRGEIGGYPTHTGEVSKDEIYFGDSIFFDVKKGRSKKPQVIIDGWRKVGEVEPEAAFAVLQRNYPNAIFNFNGESAGGKKPAPSQNWQPGFGVILETDPRNFTNNHATIIVKGDNETFILLQLNNNKTKLPQRYTQI